MNVYEAIKLNSGRLRDLMHYLKKTNVPSFTPASSSFVIEPHFRVTLIVAQSGITTLGQMTFSSPAVTADVTPSIDFSHELFSLTPDRSFFFPHLESTEFSNERICQSDCMDLCIV